MKNIKGKDTFVKEKITHKTLELKARKDCKDRKVCVCVFQLAAAAEVIIRKRQRKLG